MVILGLILIVKKPCCEAKPPSTMERPSSPPPEYIETQTMMVITKLIHRLLIIELGMALIGLALIGYHSVVAISILV